MGIIRKSLATILFLTIPVKTFMWGMFFYAIFLMICIFFLISNSSFLNSNQMYTKIESISDDVLKSNCYNSGSQNCLLMLSVFDDKRSKLSHSYMKLFNLQERSVLSFSDGKIIDVNKNEFIDTPLGSVASSREGCLELESTTDQILNLYKIKNNKMFNKVYMCYHRDVYYSLFIKGGECKSCMSSLNSAFSDISKYIYYGYNSPFILKVPFFVYNIISDFLHKRKDTILLATAKYSEKTKEALQAFKSSGKENQNISTETKAIDEDPKKDYTDFEKIGVKGSNEESDGGKSDNQIPGDSL